MTTLKGCRQFHRNGKTVIRLHPAWRSSWRYALAGAAVFAVWMFEKEVFDSVAEAVGLPVKLSALGLVFGWSPFIFAVLFRHFTRSYDIEDGRKVRSNVGFIARDSRTYDISNKIQVDLSQSVVARLLNYGTIVFWTGDDASRLEWTDVANPENVIAHIDSLKHPTVSSSGQDAASADLQIMLRAPTLKEAQNTKATHFGSNPVFKTPQEIEAKRLTTPFGHYVDNDDGTVTHEESGLMWIRAPWGSVWNNGAFQGEPIELRWDEAVRLFGRGEPVSYPVGGTFAYFGHAKRVASAYENGYKLGRCRVNFAGYSDWRLPTAAEIDRLTPYFHDNSHDGDNGDPQLSRDGKLDWRWRGKENQRVTTRLYPEFSHKVTPLWTATGLGNGLAWAFDGMFPVGDQEAKAAIAVMFVRRIMASDRVAPNIVDEEMVS